LYLVGLGAIAKALAGSLTYEHESDYCNVQCSLSGEEKATESNLSQWLWETIYPQTCSALLLEYGVKQSFPATGKPIDNAVAETFFSTFKRKEANRRLYTSEQHFRKSAEDYIRFLQ